MSSFLKNFILITFEFSLKTLQKGISSCGRFALILGRFFRVLLMFLAATGMARTTRAWRFNWLSTID